MVNHSNVIIKKPWGYEYLVYENSEVALWYLHINKGESTSLHCHPKKTTGLILLNGEAELSFLADSRKLTGPAKVMIRRGLFHKTTAITDVDMFEIETPNDKNDLVRLDDNYGRQNKAYEGQEFELPKQESCIWVNENLDIQGFIFSNRRIICYPILSIEELRNRPDEEIIVFLKGGMYRNIDNEQHLVTIPGDVGHGKIIKQVANKLDGIAEKTYIMSIL